MRKGPDGNQFVIPSEPVSKVVDGIWMGGVPPIGLHVSRSFDCLILAAKEYSNFWDYPGVEVETAELDDDPLVPMTKKEMSEAVKAAGNVVRWASGGRSVLITCRMGKNRSGLVTALALCLRSPKCTPGKAVDLIRAARGPSAMSNPQFVSFLNDYCGRRPGPRGSPRPS